jgi:hypothetical protein
LFTDPSVWLWNAAYLGDRAAENNTPTPEEIWTALGADRPAEMAVEEFTQRLAALVTTIPALRAVGGTMREKIAATIAELSERS